MSFFKILWAIDVLEALVVVYFFIVGVSDGSISSRNFGLWFVLLTLTVGILPLSLWLKAHAHAVMAKVILCIPAIPAFLYFLFVLIMLIAKPKWN